MPKTPFQSLLQKTYRLKNHKQARELSCEWDKLIAENEIARHIILMQTAFREKRAIQWFCTRKGFVGWVDWTYPTPPPVFELLRLKPQAKKKSRKQ